MLQISRRADYAVRIMLELASRPEGERISSAELAARTEVPRSFLHKIVADLAKAGLVRTYKGPNGGLMLVRSPSEINMQHILEAVDGPVCLNACLLRPSECPRDVMCPAHRFWGRLQAMVIAELQAATLEKLVAEGEQLRQEPGQGGIVYVLQLMENDTDGESPS